MFTNLGFIATFMDFDRGRAFTDGGYDRIAKKVFNNLDVDTFYVRQRHCYHSVFLTHYTAARIR